MMERKRDRAEGEIDKGEKMQTERGGEGGRQEERENKISKVIDHLKESKRRRMA